MNILLVEPDVELRYPNLALMKISAKHKALGDTCLYVKGNNYFLPFKPDIIYVSTIFTYYASDYIDTINFYKKSFPKAKMEVGGIFATLMPEYIEEKTGIKPFVGYSKELDSIPPDYSLYDSIIKYTPYVEKWRDFSILFTMRGCPRSCGFCAVKRLEPNVEIIPDWKNLIDKTKKHIMIQDNNLTHAPMEHFKDVIQYIVDNKLKACFNNGFDARLITEEQMQLLAKVKWYPGGLRLAFDNMGEDKFIQKAVKRLLELGVPKSAFLIFCMYNFHDNIEQANYRMREMANLGVRPYPQIYRPLNSIEKKDVYVDKNWTLEDLRILRQYWVLAGNYKYKKWEDFYKEHKKEKVKTAVLDDFT